MVQTEPRPKIQLTSTPLLFHPFFFLSFFPFSNSAFFFFSSAMAFLCSSQSSCSFLGSCLAILCWVLVQSHIASSALIMSLKNHHNNQHHRRQPMFQTNQSTCALFAGTWVQDETYPLYQYSDCPIIDAEFNCQMYGRPDTDYLKYRWRPLNCELPR